ncbi:MAG: hypothetical protein K6F50_01305 [Kiritimatiellae bacterium]|nr:hypothetical protein [Kiritimatiellia bacterium]
MANLIQLRMLENLDGFLLVDKPAGLAFSSVVKAVKRKFNLVKVGHGGSLDAMASGLFVLLVGDANKFAGEVMGADRSWAGEIRFGKKTDTHDAFGRDVPAPGGPIPDPESLNKALDEFRGDIFQTESRFCSIRKEGSAGYEIADTGEHKPFLSHIYRFEVSAPDGGMSVFSLKGTKNLLVRTLVNDLGDALGCGACLAGLRRTAVGKFDVSDAVPFVKILETEASSFASFVLPLSKALA